MTTGQLKYCVAISCVVALIVYPMGSVFGDGNKGNGKKCVTTPHPKQCDNYGNAYCALSNDNDPCNGNPCFHCDTTETLPEKICVDEENSDCTVTTGIQCGTFNFKEVGQCDDSMGTTICACINVTTSEEQCDTDGIVDVCE